ncbi:MAG: chorismate mutase [Clostridia bacterium]|nr:chorismate mutase [Clostridia bacterium]
MSTTEYRKQIDEIDAELVKLFARRMEVSAEIARYKQQNNLPITDLSREKEKYTAVLNQTPPELQDYSYPLFSLLIELSKSYQHRLTDGRGPLTDAITDAIENTPRLFPEYATVACQGIEGANSQFACDKLFKNANILYFSSFDAVFASIEKGLCRYGVVPVENSSAGSVNKVYDLMMQHKFYIVRSIRIKIEHNLLAKPGVKLEEIKEIYSHEQAISQCSKFLSGLKNVKVVPCENTAVAARMVATSDRRDVAALASRPCIRLYGLNCLADGVQNVDNNYTRFICITKELEIYPGANRTSMMLTLPHEQGSLYKLLSKLYALGINLNKLESRPLPDKSFEFMFYFDLDTPVYSQKLLQLMGELPGACESFAYLGSYSEVF